MGTTETLKEYYDNNKDGEKDFCGVVPVEKTQWWNNLPKIQPNAIHLGICNEVKIIQTTKLKDNLLWSRDIESYIITSTLSNDNEKKTWEWDSDQSVFNEKANMFT